MKIEIPRYVFALSLCWLVLSTGCYRDVPPLEGPLGPVPDTKAARAEQRRQAAQRVAETIELPKQRDNLDEIRRQYAEFLTRVHATSMTIEHDWEYFHSGEFWYGILTLRGDVEIPNTKPFTGRPLGGAARVYRVKEDGSERECGSLVLKVLPSQPGHGSFEQGGVKIPRCKGGKFRVAVVLTTGISAGQEIASEVIVLPPPPSDIPPIPLDADKPTS